MNNFSVPKPSIEDLVKNTKSVLIAGCGGGSDIIQTINVMNYLKKLGVEKICLATISVSWWSHFSDGCEVFDLDWFKNADRITGDLARILPETEFVGGIRAGALTYEQAFAKTFDEPIYAVSLKAGLPGVISAYKKIIGIHGCGLFITCDIGADTLFTGHETQVCSPLIDCCSVIAASELDIPGIYALNGYAGDCELHMADVNKNMGDVMKRGGYLGAIGITQSDLIDLEKIQKLKGPNSVEDWPYLAAKGEMGVYYVKRFWSMERIPAAAVTFLFDPDVLFETNPVIQAIKDTKTLEEAENAIWEKCGLIPETRLPLDLVYPMPPQYPDKKEG